MTCKYLFVWQMNKYLYLLTSVWHLNRLIKKTNSIVLEIRIFYCNGTIFLSINIFCALHRIFKQCMLSKNICPVSDRLFLLIKKNFSLYYLKTIRVFNDLLIDYCLIANEQYMYVSYIIFMKRTNKSRNNKSGK